MTGWESDREPRSFRIDGIPYTALEEPDLRWLRRYGTVFQVLDQQYSGNLCFGVKGSFGRLFVKYAGARTVRFRGRPENAVVTLRNAMPLYARRHPALTRLIAHGATDAGYAAIFEWRDALPLRAASGPSALERARRLPLEKSLKMLDMVFDLHLTLAQDGIVAVGFSDGSVLIDFERDEALVCDIGLYRRKPAFNDRGRMPGSSLFMAPEEYEQGEMLDETTTAYNMAALAFLLYGSSGSRERHAWNAPYCLWEVARRAVSESKADRYPSMRAFLEAWREAVGKCPLAEEGIL